MSNASARSADGDQETATNFSFGSQSQAQDQQGEGDFCSIYDDGEEELQNDAESTEVPPARLGGRKRTSWTSVNKPIIESPVVRRHLPQRSIRPTTSPKSADLDLNKVHGQPSLLTNTLVKPRELPLNRIGSFESSSLPGTSVDIRQSQAYLALVPATAPARENDNELQILTSEGGHMALSNIINPNLVDVVNKMVKMRAVLKLVLSNKAVAAEKPEKNPHTAFKSGFPLRGPTCEAISEVCDHIDHCIQRMFYANVSKIPRVMIDENVRENMRRAMNQADALEEAGYTAVNVYIREQMREQPGEDTSGVILTQAQTRERKAHFTKDFSDSTQWCNISNMFGSDRNTCDNIKSVLKDIGKWGMEIFELDKLTKGRPLICVMHCVFCQHDLFKKFKIKKEDFNNFFSLVESSYRRSNSYHNSIHAADVVQSANALIHAEKTQCAFTDLELMALFFSCAVHDVDHPGVMNSFMVNAKSPLAACYDDQSVLENHHVNSAFSFLQVPNCDIFEHCDIRQRGQIRKMATQMILHTDMRYHNQSVTTITEINERGFDRHLAKNRLDLLAFITHTADVSNAAKPLHLYNEWVDRVFEEFFRQGDMEKRCNLPISMMCDRETISPSKSQVGFINFVVGPLYSGWKTFVSPDANHISENLTNNKNLYAKETIDDSHFRCTTRDAREADRLPWFADKFVKDSDGEWTHQEVEAASFNQFPTEWALQEYRGASLAVKTLWNFLTLGCLAVLVMMFSILWDKPLREVLKPLFELFKS